MILQLTNTTATDIRELIDVINKLLLVVLIQLLNSIEDAIVYVCVKVKTLVLEGYTII